MSTASSVPGGRHLGRNLALLELDRRRSRLLHGDDAEQVLGLVVVLALGVHGGQGTFGAGIVPSGNEPLTLGVREPATDSLGRT